MPQKKPWFAVKQYGYGATPATWQGWLAIVVFIGLITLDAKLLSGWPRWLVGVALIVTFAVLAYVKSDSEWRWRWGRE